MSLCCPHNSAEVTQLCITRVLDPMPRSTQERVGKEQCCPLGWQLTLLIYPQHEHTPKLTALPEGMEHGRCMFGSTNSNTKVFVRAVCQHIRSFTSEQVPELLSKRMRQIMDQVFPQPMISKCLAVQTMDSMRRYSQCYCTHWWVFYTTVGLVLSISSSSGPTMNALNQI